MFLALYEIDRHAVRFYVSKYGRKCTFCWKHIVVEATTTAAAAVATANIHTVTASEKTRVICMKCGGRSAKKTKSIRKTTIHLCECESFGFSTSKYRLEI